MPADVSTGSTALTDLSTATDLGAVVVVSLLVLAIFALAAYEIITAIKNDRKK